MRFVQQVYSAAVLWASFPVDSSTKMGLIGDKHSAIFQFQGDLYIIAGESSKLYIPVSLTASVRATVMAGLVTKSNPYISRRKQI